MYLERLSQIFFGITTLRKIVPFCEFRNFDCARQCMCIYWIICSSDIVYHFLEDQQVVTEYSVPSFNDANVKHVYVDQTFFQNVEKPPGEQDASTVFGKTTADHLVTGTYLDTSQSPYVIGYYSNGDQNAYQPMSHETTYEIMKQPENGLLILQQEESTYTRKRKFPYQFYQPSSEYQEVKYAEVPQHSTVGYPQMRKWVSNAVDTYRDRISFVNCTA